MHKSILLAILLCTISLSKPARANSIATGEIYYEWTTDSTYRFYFRLYNSCGSTEPTSIPLCFHDPCDNSQSFSVTLNKLRSRGDTVYVGCTTLKNQCQDATATIPGYAKWTYAGLVTLPARCNSWHIFTHLDYRNDNKNIYDAANTPLYVETRFNNTGTYQGNSSPYFSIIPVYYFYRNATYGINNGAIDPDGDSLVTEIIDPLTGVHDCGDTVATAVTYNTMSPAISLPTNPFQTNNTFTLDSKTGYFSFKTAEEGKHSMAFRIKEYRKGVLIGSMTRETQFYVSNDTVTVPKLTVTSTSGNIKGCMGQTLNFTFEAKSVDKEAILVLSDNTFFNMPGAIINYTHQYSDSVHGTFSWTPGPADTGYVTTIIVMRDSTCHAPGFQFYYPTYVPLYIAPLSKALSDTTICLGDTAHLNVINVSATALYAWKTIPGGTSSGIICPTCRATDVHPASTTKYQVAVSNNAPCPASFDTVEITVLTNLSYPTIQISANPDTNVTAGTGVIFTAAKNNCAHPAYQWKVNGIAVPGDTTATFVPSLINDKDIITCELTCNDTCPRPRDTVSNALTMHISTGIKTNYTTDQLHIYPNPNNGSFIVKGKASDGNCKLEIINTMGQTVYQKIITTHNGLIEQQLSLDVSPGIYQLRVNNEALRFIVNTQ